MGVEATDGYGAQAAACGGGLASRPLGRVTPDALIAETSAENDARNEAGALGADTLLDLDTDLGAFEATAQAGAYRCQE